MKHKIKTIGDCLLNLFVMMLTRTMPRTAPITVKTPRKAPYFKSKLPNTRYPIDADSVENLIKCIPVADDTFGATPSYKKIGLYITPPPRPSADASTPLKNPSKTSLIFIGFV